MAANTAAMVASINTVKAMFRAVSSGIPCPRLSLSLVGNGSDRVPRLY